MNISNNNNKMTATFEDSLLQTNNFCESTESKESIISSSEHTTPTPTATSDNSIDMSKYSIQYCPSSSSLNASIQELNEVIDLTKNEFFTKSTSSLSSPNCLSLKNQMLSVGIGDSNDDLLINGNCIQVKHDPFIDTGSCTRNDDDLLKIGNVNSNQSNSENGHNEKEIESESLNALNSITIDQSITQPMTIQIIDSNGKGLQLMDDQYYTTSQSLNSYNNNEKLLAIKQTDFNNDGLLNTSQLLNKAYMEDILMEQQQQQQPSSIQTNSNMCDDYALTIISSAQNCVNLTDSQHEYYKLSMKQDASIGTDLSITKDLRYNHRDYNNSFEAYRLKRPSEKETFKLVEKVQPKKSRTKYTKDQIEVLEGAYSRNPYPDLITVEQLCKTLDISREKVNIWFQNRRARTKRTNRVGDDGTTNHNHKTNNYTKLFKNYHQQAQQTPNYVCNVATLNPSQNQQQQQQQQYFNGQSPFIQRSNTITNNTYQMLQPNTNLVSTQSPSSQQQQQQQNYFTTTYNNNNMINYDN